ncbi:MAG: S4 domain-containing protein [Actinomycetota bacterium]
MAAPEAVRVDKWLWAVRVYKTRSAANEACSTGRVAVNDEGAKPATKVRVGDVIQARRRDRTVIYEVRGLLEKRVGAARVDEFVIDRSPPVPERDPVTAALTDMGTRDRGRGRPTKRDRRRIDRLQGR